jgi:hypothetical protein
MEIGCKILPLSFSLTFARIMNKIHFLQNELIPLLETIPAYAKPLFGKMNPHQMIEHLGYAFQQASGLVPLDSMNDEEKTKVMYKFMMSDKPFRDNTPNPYLPDEPPTPKHVTISDSLSSLRNDIDVFLQTFESEPDKRILNPFFGNLNFDEWIHLLHKHMLHHLRQFGINSLNEKNS